MKNSDDSKSPADQNAFFIPEEIQYRSIKIQSTVPALTRLPRANAYAPPGTGKQPFLNKSSPSLYSATIAVGGRSKGVAPPTLARSPKQEQHTAQEKNTASAKSVSRKKASLDLDQMHRNDRTNYTTAVARGLPPKPFHLERHTHFHVRKESLYRICSVIGKKFCDYNTDFTFQPEKCKWKVDYYQSAVQRVEMRVCIYSMKGMYAVEFQRRQGDVTAFMQFYSQVKLFVRRNQLLVSDEKLVPQVKRPKLEHSSSVNASCGSKVEDAVRFVKGLLTSTKHDVCSQGVLAALSLEKYVETHDVLSELVPSLVQVVQSCPERIARCAVVALGMLCGNVRCREAFVNCVGWDAIIANAIGGAHVNPELQRESLHIVEHLCAIHSAQLATLGDWDDIRSRIMNWEELEDPRSKKYAYNAFVALDAAGICA